MGKKDILRHCFTSHGLQSAAFFHALSCTGHVSGLEPGPYFPDDGRDLLCILFLPHRVELFTFQQKAHFRSKLERMNSHWKKKLAGVLIASPANPTGTMMKPEDREMTIRDPKSEKIYDMFGAEIPRSDKRKLDIAPRSGAFAVSIAASSLQTVTIRVCFSGSNS